MQIFIATRSYEAVPIEISGTATVSDLKKKISMILPNFKIIDQRLNFKSKILLDSDTIIKSGIQENSVIDLLTIKRKNVVFIQMVDNVVHELKVDDFATNVNAIKKQISEILHIPVEYQQLYINQIELHNNDMLSDKLIGPETTLNLIYANLDIRLHYCQQNCGGFKTVSLPGNSKIFQIKQLAEPICKTPAEHQILYFKDQKLDIDENTLIDYKILNHSYIQIKIDDFEIFIEPTFFIPNKISLRVFPSETVKQVKDKIESDMKWNSIEQKLFWNLSILHDGDILREKGITSSSLLYLFVLPHLLYLNIQAEPGQNIKIVCQTTENVGQLMKKIETATQIPVENQILYWNNKRWSCQQRFSLLIELSLNEFSNIILKREEYFKIFVRTMTGKKLILNLQESDTVENIKRKIQDCEGIPCYQQRIIFGGKKLENGQSVESYGIRAECTVHLVLRLRG